MKKYLQACEIAGSIYGKSRTVSHKDNNKKKATKKEDLVASYNKFYKNQLSNMDKLFHRN